MLERINVFDTVNNELTRERVPKTLRAPTFYPSSASIRLGNGRLDGGCHRQDWYRIKGVPETNDGGQKLAWRGAIGKACETIFLDNLKKSGMYEASGVKFYDPDTNVSGELDGVGRDTLRMSDGTMRDVFFSIENKSIYGDYSVTQQITGRRPWRGQPAIVPYPKLSHLMQAMLYVWHFRDVLIGDKLCYVARDTGDQKEYNIRLRQFEENGQVFHAAEVDGVPNRKVTVEAIHDRYRILKEKLLANQIPEPEYELRWSEETFRLLKEDMGDPSPNGPGTLSKKKTEEWEAGGEVGDWQCSYCNWKDRCQMDRRGGGT